MPAYTYKYGYGFDSGASANQFNICCTLTTDGTWYGGLTSANITPDSTITSQTFYALKWKADGTFVMQFGVAGNEQVPDVPDIKLYTRYQTAPVVLVWDATNLYYTDTDATLAGLLISAQTGGATTICFDGELFPTTIISYDYNLETIV